MRPATRGAHFPLPSLVVEVGESQSRTALWEAGDWWIENTEGFVRFVILIKLMARPVSFKFECSAKIPFDETQESPNPSPPWIIMQHQMFDIDSQSNVTSNCPALRIPYKCIFDLGHEHATDIVFTKDDLSRWADWAYGQMAL